MEKKNINNSNFKNEILEIDIGPNGEFDEETTKFILEKVQEAIDEDTWYTQEEVIEALDKLEEENSKCTILPIYGKENFKFKY